MMRQLTAKVAFAGVLCFTLIVYWCKNVRCPKDEKSDSSNNRLIEKADTWAVRINYKKKLKETFVGEETFCQERHIGCFQSLSGELNAKYVTTVIFNLMSVKWCTSFCASQRKTYAGLRNSSLCVCSEYTPEHFVILERSSMTCNETCPGNTKEICGGRTSFSVHRVSSPCVKAPFPDDYVKSRSVGCFIRPSGVTSFERHESESVNDCLFICEKLRHPLAMFGDENECTCGMMTDRFNLSHKIDDCDATNLVRVFRTTVPDNRCEKKQFLRPLKARKTALTSFPGSGNTWARYLLEAATGYYTGSVYIDPRMIQSGFIGGCVSPKEYRVGIIKDHLLDNNLPLFDQTILLIRNPYHAHIAEFNRQRTKSHVKVAPKQVFKKDFERYFNKSIGLWKAVHRKVLLSKKPFRVFYYEAMAANPVETTREMVKFLANPTLQPSDINSRLACVSQQINGENKREPSKLSLDPYTLRMKELLNSEIKEIKTLLESFSVKTPLPEYEIAL